MHEKHRHFVDRYVVHGNATKAAEEAGYSESRARVTGAELLKRPDIAAELRRRQSERARRLGIDADYVVAEALEVLALAKSGTPQTYHGDPIPDPENPGEWLRDRQLASALGALNTLTKVLGLGAAERKIVEHEGEIVYTLRIDGAPDVIDGTIVPDALEEGDE